MTEADLLRMADLPNPLGALYLAGGTPEDGARLMCILENQKWHRLAADYALRKPLPFTSIRQVLSAFDHGQPFRIYHWGERYPVESMAIRRQTPASLLQLWVPGPVAPHAFRADGSVDAPGIPIWLELG